MKGFAYLSTFLMFTAVSGVAAQEGPTLSAEAERGDEGASYGLNVLARDSTLPANTLAVRWDIGLDHPRDQVVEDFVSLGLSYGLMDRLELGASLVPISLGFFDTDVAYLDPSVYASYLVSRGHNEVLARVSSTIPLDENSSPNLDASVIANLLRGDSLFSTGLETSIVFDDETTISLSIPSLFYYSVSDTLYVMLGSGFIAQDIGKLEDTWSLPLYSEVGLSFGDEQPAFDLWMGLEFPRFIHNDGSDTNVWSIQVSSRAYLWL